MSALVDEIEATRELKREETGFAPVDEIAGEGAAS
jgi:hypothetical protein